MAKKQVTQFLLLFEGRTGSTYLMTSLDSHPHVRAEGELLVGRTPEQQRRVICRTFRVPLFSALRATGFKTKLRDVAEPDEMRRLVNELDAKLIYMARHNTVKHVISVINSRRLYDATNKYNLADEGDRLPPFAIDIEDLEQRLEYQHERDAELGRYVASMNRPTLKVHYEDILVDSQAVFARTFEFLGVEPRPLEETVKKNTPDDLREIVLNLDELRAHFAGTRYEGMFDEVLAPHA